MAFSVLGRLPFVMLLTTVACSATIEGTPGNGADASDNNPNDPPQDCPGVDFATTPVTPSISLLIDRSQSMGDSIGGQSRYQAVRDSLVGTTGVVTQLESRAHFGASLYSTDAPCPKLYSVGRAMNNRAAIAQLIDSQRPEGNTPTGPSIDQAVAAFQAAPPPVGSPPVIVLATDGLPNGCNGGNGEQASINAAAASFAAGIRLFVLSVGNGINDGHLQAVANAGAGVQPGQPNAPYYIANTPQDLRAAFDQIISGVVSCELQLSGTVDPQRAAAGTVKLNGMPLTFGTDWELASGTVLRLLGNACSTLKTTPGSTVTATFPCGAVLL